MTAEKAVDHRRQLGRRGEDLAAVYLLQRGYRLLARNWHCATGELDLIMQDGETLVFVEVRTRRGQRFGTAAESVTPAKQAKLIEVAQTYLQEAASPPPAWRIDVVAVQLDPGGMQIHHFENAVGW